MVHVSRRVVGDTSGDGEEDGEVGEGMGGDVPGACYEGEV